MSIMFKKPLYVGKSQFGSYRIVDTIYNGRPSRVLYGDDRTPQSGTALDGDPELLFNYNQRFLEMIAGFLPKRILIIGGGVLMLPIAVFDRFPQIAIDVVEIDELLVDLSYEYFDAPLDPRLTIHVQDGKEYLQSTHQRYDMIIVDAFSGFTIPAHLLEHDTVALYKKHLRSNGVLAINALSRIVSTKHRLAKEVVATFEEVFAETTLFQADSEQSLREDQNVIIVASDAVLDFEYVQSVDVSDSL